MALFDTIMAVLYEQGTNMVRCWYLEGQIKLFLLANKIMNGSVYQPFKILTRFFSLVMKKYYIYNTYLPKK